MKKTISLCVLLLASITFLFGQSSWQVIENSKTQIKLRLQTSNIEVSEIKTNEGFFSQLAIHNAHNSVDVGNPQLPVYNEMLEIPLGAELVLETRIINQENVTAAALGIEHPVYPAQPSYSKSDEGPFALVINNKTYAANNFYAPSELATIAQRGVYRCTNLAELAIAPISYNPVAQEFIIVKELEITIKYASYDWAATQRMKDLHNNPFFSHISGTILNNEPVLTPSDLQASPIRYTIIANSMFEGALDEFIAWKKRKGFLVDEMYTNNPEVGTSTTSIKNYLQGLYDNATPESPAPTFVLFVGDMAQLTTFDGTTDNHVTDLYYVTFTNGDNLPDAYYGRFSATNLAQLTPQIEKTLVYEQYTMEDDDYLNDAVLVAGYDSYWSTTHANGQVNYMKNNYFNTTNGYATVHAHMHPCSNEASQIRSEISAGVGIANYTAHCMSAGWGDPAFEVSHVSSMTNRGKYGLMIGNCCLSGKFDDNVCFGEALLRADGKGAMAYIGASNSSTWDEDFYWTVGVRSNINATPTYSPSNLGCYDRLFHTHNEAVSEWITTVDAIIQAGNMSVENSPSNSSLYYWEIYHLFGDPSVMPYLAKPSSMQVQVSPTIPISSTTLNVQTPPYAFVALTYNNELFVSGYANENGEIALPLVGLNVGEYELAVWAQKYVQYFQNIQVIPDDGSYITPTNVAIGHQLPTSNNAYLELDVIFSNYGNEDANNCYAKVTSDSEHISLITDSLWLGNFNANETRNANLAFAFKTNYYVEDQTPVSFNILTIAAGDTTFYPYNIVINAPKLQYVNAEFAELEGNNNNTIEGGETVRVTVTTENIGHNSISELTARLNSYFSGAIVTEGEATFAGIGSEETATATFEVTLSESLEEGSSIPLYFQIYRGDYYVSETIYLVVGNSIEDFESNGLETFPWTNNNNPWIVTNSSVQEGEYAARSYNNLNSYASSIMAVTCQTATDGEISFLRKVSSEEGYDFFNFYIDNIKMYSASGDENWEEVSFPVTAGEHTFGFEYKKDQSMDAGQDAAWIDNIIFPPIGDAITEDIAHLNVENHILTSNESPIVAMLPGMDLEVTFEIENPNPITAQNITALLSSSNARVSVVEPSQQIVSLSQGENTSITFSINSDELEEVMNTDNYINLANFELNLSYENGETTYPFSIDFSGKCVGIESFEITETEANIYPNPAKNVITITCNTEMATVIIYDLQGKEVKRLSNLNNTNITTNVAELHAGLYFVKIIDTNNNQGVKKLIVE